MVQNIKEGIKKNRPLLFFALAIAVLLSGMVWVSHTPGVEAAPGGMTLGVCFNGNVANGGGCAMNSQCSSGICVGGNGTSCSSGVCQPNRDTGGGPGAATDGDNGNNGNGNGNNGNGNGNGGNGTTYSCTGTLPANSNLCSGDDTGLSEDTAYTTVENCSVPSGSAPKCEAKCQGNTVPLNGQCVTNEIGNVFGYAWSDNIGWIKMNSCVDDNPQDGVADSPSCYAPGADSFGVSINNNGTIGGPGTLSGHAWSDHLGWIDFGVAGQTAPTGGDAGASLTNISANVGTFAGWAKVLTGGATPGFDGWISLSGTNYPSGNGHEDGDGGLTYNRLTGRLMGSIWGGEAIGWIKFNDPVNNYHKVTYGAPAPFDYAIEAPQNSFSSPTPGIFSYTSKITLSLTSGKTESVTLSKQVTGPAGADMSKFVTSFSGEPSCDPDCQKDLLITGTSATTPGNYQITITGTSATGIVRHPVSPITVLVPANITATCEPDPVVGQPPYLVNTPVKWKAVNVVGDNLSYSWSSVGGVGTNVLAGLTGANISKTYSTTGIKDAYLTLQNTDGSFTVKCIPSVNVIVNPHINEF